MKEQILKLIDSRPLDFGIDAEYTDKEMVGITLAMINKQNRLFDEIRKVVS